MRIDRNHEKQQQDADGFFLPLIIIMYVVKEISTT